MRKVYFDELQAGLARAEENIEWHGSLSYAENAARAARWADLGDGSDRERFRATASELAGNFGKEDESHRWAWIGGLWHLAGDPDAAKPWLKRVVKERKQHAAPHLVAGSRYLLGDYRKAAKVHDGGPAASLAEVARSRVTTPLPVIRERLVAIAMDGSDGPHTSGHGDPLTAWDWIEESFLLESRLTGRPTPTHVEMLDEIGVLTRDPRPPVPPPLSPEVGLRVDLPSGAWLEVDQADWIEIFVPPAFSLVVRQEHDLWGAWLADHCDWILDNIYPDWRHAASEAAQTVRMNFGVREGDAIDELALQAGGDAGVPVPVPAPHGPPPKIVRVYPTIEFTSYNIVDVELADDLYLQFREPWDSKGWYGRVAFEDLAVMDDVVPGPHATWQDAAHEMIAWLTEHQDGRGVPELERFLREYPGDTER